jgi:UPF0755 protein
LSRGDRSRPGRERNAEERERDRQERARRRALRAGEEPPEPAPPDDASSGDPPSEPAADEAPSVLPEWEGAFAEEASSAGEGAGSTEDEPFAFPLASGDGDASGEPIAHPEASTDEAGALPVEDAPFAYQGAGQDEAGALLAQDEPSAYMAAGQEEAGALPAEDEPPTSAPGAAEAMPVADDRPPVDDAAVDPAPQPVPDTPATPNEPIDPAPQERSYSEDPAHGVPVPPLPPVPPPAAGRTPAPERSTPPPASRRSRSVLARVAAVLALAAVAAALLLLLHSLRSKPAAKVVVPTVVKLVIPEGKTRPQIAQIATAAGLTGSYRAASRHSPLLNPAHYGAPSGTSTLEGFLFPATYDMDKGAAADRLVQEQLIAFRENFGAHQIARAHALHITPYDLLIVASMVEREAQLPGDRAKIAAVIYNRLREGIPLGIDATIYYAVELATGIPTYTHELSEAQLHIDSPYNTRLHTGLPPTPISNPGLASIEAAANPAHVSYLYYVAGADGCGEQVFSNTLAEFEAHSAAYKAAVEKNGGHPPTCKHK